MIKDYQFSCNVLDKIEFSRNQYPLIQCVIKDNTQAVYHLINSTLNVKNNRIRAFTYGESDAIPTLEKMLGIKHIREKEIK